MRVTTNYEVELGPKKGRADFFGGWCLDRYNAVT